GPRSRMLARSPTRRSSDLERIERECYARVAPSLASMSFDFGPTLLEWMEHHAPGTCAAVVAAGRAGGALAMPYHHLIHPLEQRGDRKSTRLNSSPGSISSA